ncbi:response regulator [Candidatus Woesearchaeota archaeon]|nr:MAG: response regulator [Candidatus Woesearchaeota archaeon]
MKKTILVVDDEPDIREMNRLVLESEGFRVVLAGSGEECIEKLKTNKVDLVLLDIMMPGMQTKDILPKVKVKVIFVSSVQMTSEEKEELFRSPNVAGYLSKPYDKKEFISAVKAALR